MSSGLHAGLFRVVLVPPALLALDGLARALYRPRPVVVLAEDYHEPLAHDRIVGQLLVRYHDLGGVGRLAKSKGFDVLLRAFAAAALPSAKLAIVGDGRERARLEKLAASLGLGADRVRFAGFRNDVKDCYQAFDLFVSPSRSEPLGRVLFEALDAGTPVLATATQGPSEVLPRFPGRLVPIGDVPAMAAALRELAASPPPRVRPDLSAYHLDHVAARTLAAYRELIAAGARGH